MDAPQTVKWRRISRLPGPLVWVVWGVAIYLTLITAHMFGDLGLLALPLALVAAVMIEIGLRAIASIAIAPIVARVLPATTPRPPPLLAEPDARYEKPPQIQYPPIAQARGQSGWVWLALQVAADGRIRRYRVIKQEPPRLFERAATTALARARLPRGERTVEIDSLIVFVVPSDAAPTWVRERLAAAVG